MSNRGFGDLATRTLWSFGRGELHLTTMEARRLLTDGTALAPVRERMQQPEVTAALLLNLPERESLGLALRVARSEGVQWAPLLEAVRESAPNPLVVLQALEEAPELLDENAIGALLSVPNRDFRKRVFRLIPTLSMPRPDLQRSPR